MWMLSYLINFFEAVADYRDPPLQVDRKTNICFICDENKWQMFILKHSVYSRYR